MDRPPPTQRSKPGPCSGWTVPTNETSLTSGAPSRLGWPVSGRLELAGQVGVVGVADVAALDLVERRGGVDDLVRGDAGDRGAEERAGRVAARLQWCQAGALEALPDRGDVLDPDPVVLDVLPVGDVGGVPGVLRGGLAEGAQLAGAEEGAVGADPHHEVLSSSSCSSEGGGLAAVEALLALGVEPHPAEAAAQVVPVDRVEPPDGVDVLDPVPHVEGVVLLLGLLVVVQRLAVAEGPLALATLGAPVGARRRRARGGGWRRSGGLGGECAGAVVMVFLCAGWRPHERGRTDDVVGVQSATAVPGVRGWAGRVRPTYTSCCGYDRGPRGVEPRGAGRSPQ